jgi:hypothetical protein
MGLDALLARLEIRAVTSARDDVTPAVTQKPAPIEACTSVTAGTARNDIGQLHPDAFAERAAIIEHDGAIPRTWAEGFARLDPNYPAAGVDARRWVRFVDDCGLFLDRGWAAKAAALGWGPLELSGVTSCALWPAPIWRASSGFWMGASWLPSQVRRRRSRARTGIGRHTGAVRSENRGAWRWRGSWCHDATG